MSALEGGEIDLSALARPLARVSESTLVDQVLRELRRKRQHMALVVDEYGTTVGLVTLEDIIEEIVGEFEEEEDGEHDLEIRRDGDYLVLAGAAQLGDVEDALGVEIENTGEATIGGHLIELLGRVPEAGEAVDLAGRRRHDRRRGRGAHRRTACVAAAVRVHRRLTRRPGDSFAARFVSPPRRAAPRPPSGRPTSSP